MLQIWPILLLAPAKSRHFLFPWIPIKLRSTPKEKSRPEGEFAFWPTHLLYSRNDQGIYRQSRVPGDFFPLRESSSDVSEEASATLETNWNKVRRYILLQQRITKWQALLKKEVRFLLWTWWYLHLSQKRKIWFHYTSFNHRSQLANIWFKRQICEGFAPQI